MAVKIVKPKDPTSKDVMLSDILYPNSERVFKDGAVAVLETNLGNNATLKGLADWMHRNNGDITSKVVNLGGAHVPRLFTAEEQNLYEQVAHYHPLLVAEKHPMTVEYTSVLSSPWPQETDAKDDDEEKIADPKPSKTKPNGWIKNGIEDLVAGVSGKSKPVRA